MLAKSSHKLNSCRIRKVLSYIDANLTQVLTVDELANVGCYSTFHFSRLFKEHVGEPVKSYVRRLRLEKASIDLVLNNCNIAEVAKTYGFKSNETFSRAYQQYFGELPSKRRSKHKAAFSDRLANWSSLHSARNGVFDVSIPEVDSSNAIELSALGAHGESISLENNSFSPRVKVKILKDTSVHYTRLIGLSCSHSGSMIWEWFPLVHLLGIERLADPANVKMVIFRDDPGITPPEMVRRDLCIYIRDGEEFPALETQVIRGGFYASMEYSVNGADTQEREAMDYLFNEWLPTSGYRLMNCPVISVAKETDSFSMASDSRGTNVEALIAIEEIPIELK